MPLRAKRSNLITDWYLKRLLRRRWRLAMIRYGFLFDRYSWDRPLEASSKKLGINI
jgi:hypothetical protein